MVDLISSKWCKIAVSYLLGVDESLIGNGSREMAVCLNVETGGVETLAPACKADALPSKVAPPDR